MKKAFCFVAVVIAVVPASAVSQQPDEGPRLTSSAFLALLPNGETKRRFILDCTGCHQFDAQMAFPDGVRRTHASWVERTAQMLSFAGASSGFPIMAPSRKATSTADWLTESLAGKSPTPVGPTEVPAGFTITEYELPRSNDLPHDVAVDGEGRVIVTGQLSGVMYTLDPATSAFVESSLPMANPRAVEVDGFGQWWVVFGGPNTIGRFHPGKDDWETWSAGTYPHEAALDPAGRVWFNGHFSKEPEVIGYVDPALGETRTFNVPVETMPDGGSTIPYGLRAAPDGTIWMTELIGGRLVKFDPDPESETFTLYPLPTSYSGPRRLDIAADGTVWIPEFANNRLARFDPENETFSEYELPTPDALPYVARVDHRSGIVWVGTAGADMMVRFDPATETFTEIPLPTSGALTRHIAVDPRNGDVWGGYGPFPPRGPKIFRLESHDEAQEE
jgi:virginiamycin B lyase